MRHSTVTTPTLDDLLLEVERAWDEGRGYERACQLAEQSPTHADDLFGFLDALIASELGTTPDAAAAARSAAGLADHLEACGDRSLADAVRRAGGLAPPEESDAARQLPASPHGPEPPPVLSGAAPSFGGCTVHRLDCAPGRAQGRGRADDRSAERGPASYPDYAGSRLGMNPREVAVGHRVPMRFLQKVDENPYGTPLAAVEEVARRGAALGLDYDEALAVLLATPDPAAAVPMAASSSGPLHAPQAFSYHDLVVRSFKDPAEQEFWLSLAR